MPDLIFHLPGSFLNYFQPDLWRTADTFLHGAMTYFFMALFVPSFVVIITVILYFVIYFIITMAAALAVNTISALGGLSLAARVMLTAAAPAGAYGAMRFWKKWRARPPSGPAALLSRLDETLFPEYGVKAASLGELASAGLRVPFGFAFSHKLFAGFARFNKIEQPSGFGNYDDDFTHIMHVMRDTIRRGKFPAAIRLLLRVAHLALWLRGGMDPSFIVRSSFGGEDAPGSLAPGQYGSFGARGFRKMMDAIRECWCSYYTERAYLYRNKMGVPQEPGLSFIIQVHLPMDLLGTAASANPATGFREELVVDFSAPPADPHVVSEQSDAETVIYNIADSFPDPPADPQFPFLAELAAGMRSLDSRCEGAPIVEWAFSGGKLYFLQFRPMAGLPQVSTYVSSGMVEIAGEPLSPMALSMIQSVRSLDSFITEPVSMYMEKPPSAGNILRVIEDRVYARFSALAELSESMKPDFGEMKKFVKLCREQAAGIRAFIAEIDAEISLVEKTDLNNKDAEEIRKMLVELNEKLQGPGAGRQAVAAHIAQSLAALLEMILAPLGAAAADTRSLPVYEDGCVALRRTDLLGGIAERATGAPGPGQSVPPGVPESLWEQYMDEFGFLGPADEIDPAVARIAERPEDFARLFSVHPDEAGSDKATEVKKKKSYAAHLRAVMRGRGGQNLIPWDTVIFRLLYRDTRKYATLREELRYKLLRGWAAARKLLLELASRDPFAGELADPGLIFFLKMDELAPGVFAAGAAAAAAGRRAEFLKNREKPFRDVLHVSEDGAVLDDARGGVLPNGENVLRGRAASAGAATGTGRLITRMEDVERLKQGEIAVVETCSPWMSVIFTRAAGAVALSGGVVSHLALAAREYHAPMIVGVRGVAGEDLDGKKLEIDTTAECVRVLE